MEVGKRKLEVDLVEDAPEESKKIRLDVLHTRGLIELSDDVLMCILKYLNSHDLLVLSEVCVRLDRIASDESLWKCVDTREYPLKPSRFRKLLRFMGKKTKVIRIGGNLDSRTDTITPSILATITENCPNLEELTLHKCQINAEKITVEQFPKSLKSLGLTNCNVINISDKRSYFFQSHLHLSNLESIDLTNSGWLSNHSIQAVGRCSTLKRVILRGCKRIGEVFVYTALATRFGFQNTTFIDLRDTFVGDSEVTCFGRLPKVTHLYLGRTNTNMQITAPDHSESNGRITDRGVLSMCLGPSDVNSSGKIQYLCLANTDVTNDCLKRLAAAFPLKVLDVQGTQIDSVGVESFKQIRPNCKILYSGVENDEND